MTTTQSKLLAQQLLDSEFESFENNPLEYCLSIGWDKDSSSVQKAIKNAKKIVFDTTDVDNLTSIIESCRSNDTLEICERNSVTDFLNNCVAKHIIEN